MDYQTITYAVNDNIAVLTMNRADVMNAMNAQMRAEILYAVKAAGNDARVLVITGNGRAFCAGQDLGDGASAAKIDLERVLRDEYGPMIQAINDSPIPTIAAVNGAAAGAGANLALTCDVVIATESAVFLQAFSRLGLIPDAGGTYSLPRLVGNARAMGTSLFAEPVDAKTAAEWGMIWEAIADDEFEAHWKKRAAKLANGPTVGYRYIKEALKASPKNDLETQLSLEAKLQGKCGSTRDFTEGVVAFLDKRKPEFEGR